jgi:hypothetical protein
MRSLYWQKKVAARAVIEAPAPVGERGLEEGCLARRSGGRRTPAITPNWRSPMTLCKRILAGLVLLLGTIGLLLSVAGGIGIWVVKGPVTERATKLVGRADAALDVAERNLTEAKASLDRAAERLESIKEEQRQLAQQPQRGGAVRRLLAQQFAPQFDNARETLHIVAEAAVVFNSILEDVGNFSLLSASGLDTDRLAEINNRLGDVAPAAWELSRLFGGPDPGSDSEAEERQLSRIEQALQTARGMVVEYESQVTQVRQRTAELKSRTLPWITPAAALLSFVCFWIALSQVSLLAHAWSWWKGPGHSG